MTRAARPRRPGGIAEVARLAGVSVGTVSNVLNNPHLVAEDTRTRVEQIMRETGFVRNAAARQLTGAPSMVVGCVMLDLSNVYFAEVARGIEERLAVDGCVAVQCSTDVLLDRENHYLRALLEIRVRGILIASVDPGRSDLLLLPARGTPIVLLDVPRDDLDLCAAAMDNVLGGRLAAEHLLDLGHRRIALLRAETELRTLTDRAEGVSRAVRERGLDPAEVLLDVPVVPPRLGGTGEIPVRQAMSDARPPTAFLCFNDTAAMMILPSLREAGIAVPHDVSVVGYDDIHFAANLSPALTTVRQPAHDLGWTAADLLLSEVKPDHRHREVIFTPELVVRQSTAPPPARETRTTSPERTPWT